MNTLQIFKAIAMIAAVSVDVFAAGFSYGADGIKIPRPSVAVILLTNIGFTIISVLLGSCLTDYLPISAVKYVSCAILGIMGAVKLSDGIIKARFKDCPALKKDVSFSVLSIKLIFSVYINPKTADTDSSKLLSPKEAIILAISIAADSIPIGINLGLMHFSLIAVIILAIIINEIAIRTGNFIGKKASEKLMPNLSWAGGAVLLIMALSKII